MAKAIRMVESEPENSGTRYNDQQEAMRDLKFAFRRITTQLEGAMKMANLENAGPTNADKRRKAFQELLRESKKDAAVAFDAAIAGMA